MISLVRRPWILALLFVVFTAYSCSSMWYGVTINYRLTLVADTPDGPKTGSGVIQVSYGSQFNLNGGGYKPDNEITGEAIPLDLGRGKVVFVTLTNTASGRPSKPVQFDGALNAIQLPTISLGLSWPYGEEFKLKKLLKEVRKAGPKPVAFPNLPTLVTFRDFGDPRTIGIVQPDEFASAFGPGYALRSAHIELTRDSVTKGIERYFSWWTDADLKQKILLPGERIPPYDSPRNIVKWGFKVVDSKL